ncbi:hypothetical protein [Streptomyces sp. NPDC001658]
MALDAPPGHGGTAIEAPHPPELRERIARTVAELAERYGNPDAPGGD